MYRASGGPYKHLGVGALKRQIKEKTTKLNDLINETEGEDMSWGNEGSLIIMDSPQITEIQDTLRKLNEELLYKEIQEQIRVLQQHREHSPEVKAKIEELRKNLPKIVI